MASDMRLIEFCTEVEVVRLVFLGGAEGKLGRRRRGSGANSAARREARTYARDLWGGAMMQVATSHV